MKLSFIIPCYKSEKTVESVVEEIKDTVCQKAGYEYEIILVNDCSPDGVLNVLIRLAEKDSRIKVIDLAKNRGKASAVLAGITKATGELTVFVDDDGQCPLDQLWSLVEPVENGHAVATAKYFHKKQAWWRNIGSAGYQWLMRKLINQPKNIVFTNFTVAKRFVTQEMIRYKNPYPSLPGLFLQATTDIVNVAVDERERMEGKSGYTLWKSIKLLVNGCTNFSIIPLRAASFLGMIFSLIGFCGGLYTIIQKLINPTILAGYSSIVSIMLFIGGIIMLLLGIIGEYLGRIFICINQAPQYVIRQEWNT